MIELGPVDLKDYLIFRVDEREQTEELAGESDLEAEAVGFAGLIAETEPEGLDGISYEVRRTATGERIHTARGGRRAAHPRTRVDPLFGEVPLRYIPARAS